MLDNEVLDGSGTCITLLANWNHTVPDTNATTACGASEFLDGDGNCVSFLGWGTDTNASTACGANEFLDGSGTCYGWIELTDTNATTQCGTGEFLDGDGNCVNFLGFNSDTNATTQCSDNEVLDGSGTCITLSDGWNRTDQGNTTAEIETVAIARLSNITGFGTAGFIPLWENTTSMNESSIFEAGGHVNVSRNFTAFGLLGNISYSYLESYPPNCAAGQFVIGLGDTLTCATPPDTNITSWLVDGWNRTDQGNTSAEIQAVIPPDTNITDTNMSTAGWLVDGWNRTDQGNTSAEIQAVVDYTNVYFYNESLNMSNITVCGGTQIMKMDGAGNWRCGRY